jgi:hypothetical protein
MRIESGTIICCAAFVAMVLSCAGCGRGVMRNLDAASAAGQEAPEDAAAVLARLAQKDRLVLNSASDQPAAFSFIVEGCSGYPLAKLFELEVGVAPRQVAVVMRAGNGMPFACMTPGRLVMVDLQRPGSLLVVEGGAPHMQLHARDGSPKWYLRQVDGGEPKVEADISSIVAWFSSYDSLREGGGQLLVVKGDSRMLLEPDNAGAYPLGSLSIIGKAGVGLRLGNIRTGPLAQRPVELNMAKLEQAPDRLSRVREPVHADRPILPPRGFPADQETFIAASLLQAALEAQRGPIAADALLERQHETLMGIRFRPPRNWTVERDGEHSVELRPEGDDSGHSIGISVLPAPGGLPPGDLDHFARWVIRQAGAVFYRFHMIDTDTVTELGGQAARSVQYIAMKDGVALQFVNVFTLADQRVVTVAYAAPLPLVDRYRNVAQAVFASMLLDPP